MKVFIDTSAFYALATENDRVHGAARAIHEQLKRTAASLVTTNYVLLETVSLLQRRHGVATAERVGDFVADRVDIIWMNAAQHRATWKRWKEQRNRGLSLVDCASFVIMRELNLRHAFAFDAQFQTAGFQLVTQAADGIAERRAVYRTSRLRR